uniref:Uncharacterized protein n=1 Tax=Trichinella nativa TaxID=6335 RepID=A0A0V1KIY2_9BILA
MHTVGPGDLEYERGGKREMHTIGPNLWQEN